MNRFQTLTFGAAAFAALSVFGGCESDRASNQARPTRAVEAPVEQNSALGEMTNDAAAATPIVSVDGPNSKNDRATVHTILDKPTPPTVTVTPPTTTPPPTIINQPAHSDPVNGQPNQ